MSEWFITDADIVELARNFESIIKQDDNDTYLLKGLDSWGDQLHASVAIRDNVIIVTVFYKKELP